MHGNFFEKLFEISPEAIIYSSWAGKITNHSGNWQDKNIGGIMNPMYYSDACECK